MLTWMRAQRSAAVLAMVFFLVAAAFSLALQGVSAQAAWADSVAEFDYGTTQFNFSYAGQTHATDVFENLKNVMPGDVRRQSIEIRNALTSQHDVKIYFTVTAIGEDDYEFFDQMTLKIEQLGAAEPLYEGSCAKQASMPDGVYLGTFSPGEDTYITVTLSVSPEMSNAYQGAQGTSYGVFTAEVIGVDDPVAPDPSDDEGLAARILSRLPQTGDAVGVLVGLLALAILVSSAMLVVAAHRRR